VFICPSDATNTTNIQRYGAASCSYAANMLIFNPRAPMSLTQAMPEGMSNSVMFSERMLNCAPTWGGVTMPGWNVHPAYVGHGWDTPVFGWNEYYQPIYGGNPTSYQPSINGNRSYPFQTAPLPSACDWYVTQSTHNSQLVVGLGDGSARTVSNGVTQTTWTAACNPLSGTRVGDDWN